MNQKGNTSVIIVAIIAAFVIFLGGYLWLHKKSENPPSAPAQSEQNNDSNQPDNSQLTVGALPPDISPAAIINSTNNIIKNNMHTITIETNYGNIEFTTYDADAPKTVKNFIDLAQKGFYDNLIFHRVIRGFMIQGGDPNGTGMGGPGYQFEDELNPATESYKAGYKRGVVAMANAGPNTNGSQFFIMHQDYPLPHNYTIFGKVTKGQEVVDAIATVKTDASDKPITPVTMKKVTVNEIK
ncbi:MAG: peptidylprolyl isomerase [bacterium]